MPTEVTEGIKASTEAVEAVIASPEQVGQPDEQVGAFDVGQESEAEAANALKIGPAVVQNFRPDFGAEPAEDGGEDEGGQVGDAEHEAILKQKFLQCSNIC